LPALPALFLAMPAQRQPKAMPQPWRAHKSRVAIPRAGTLVQQERNYIYDLTGVMCSVRHRKSFNCRALSMWGNPKNMDRAKQMAIDFMEEKLRIDVCKCIGFQK